MSTWILNLAFSATLCAGTAPAQAPTAPEIPAALVQRYDQLVEDWTAANTKYEQEATEARAQRKTLPPGPHKAFAPRFVELARAGHPGAAGWVLQFHFSTSDSPAERSEIFLACERVLVPFALAAEDPARPVGWWPAPFGVAELLRSLGSGSSTIGKSKALALCGELFDKVATPESKAKALETQVNIELQSAGSRAEPPAEALELLRRLAKDFEKTEPGLRAAGLLFRLENLKVGKSVPEFEARDVEDQPFKISDYRGKVVVIQFWGLWQRECARAVPETSALVQRLEDKPFAWIGIDTDSDKDAFKKSAAALGVNWRNSWQGSITGALPRAWGIASVPYTLVCDAKGVIRYINPRGEALTKAVEALLEELAAGGGSQGKH